MRSLRTALHFGLRDPGRRVIAITSPGPGAGKSTLSANLALLLAEACQSVVLVDADLRLGHLSRYLGGPERTPLGLADVLAAMHELDDVLQPIEPSGRAMLLPKGTTPPNPSELLLTERLGELVAALRERFDWVMIDTPPIMAVTDAAILGQEASAVFVVARSGRDEVAAVTDSVRRLQQSSVKVAGLILNDFGARRDSGAYASYHYHYHYDYSEKGKGKGKKK